MKTIPFGSPIIGEKEKQAVLDVLSSPILVHGPRTKEFEEKFADFTNAKYAISVSSCTAAMHLFYFYNKIGPGDEVIVPAQTHVATAHCVELTGAKPVFIDAEITTGNIDIQQIESHITEKTRAIAVVHFLGMPVGMEWVNKIAQKNNLNVLEDCALAVGTQYKNNHAGLLGDVGCFSFYPVKHITTAEGGMLITNDEKIAKSIALQKAFGVNRRIEERKIPGDYDVIMLGFNYRMNEIQAAIGCKQLERVENILQLRKQNYDILSSYLSEIDEIQMFKSSYDSFQSSYYCLTILLNDTLSPKRTEIINCLKNNGVGTSIYYPKPVPVMTYYQQKYGYKTTDFPVASKISNQSIALPVGPHLNEDDMKYIVENLKHALYEVKK